MSWGDGAARLSFERARRTEEVGRTAHFCPLSTDTLLAHDCCNLCPKGTQAPTHPTKKGRRGSCPCLPHPASWMYVGEAR